MCVESDEQCRLEQDTSADNKKKMREPTPLMRLRQPLRVCVRLYYRGRARGWVRPIQTTAESWLPERSSASE